MDMFEKLNVNQMAAVMDESCACLVNAQVGSGKTTVLIAKVCFLHQEKNVPLSDMVVLTFTNKAANEIKDRLKAADTSITDDDLAYFGTFHSVALKMLKALSPLEKIGYSSDFAVMDADEKVDMANAIVNSSQLNIKYLGKLGKRLEEAAKGKYIYANMKYPDDIEALLDLYANEKRIQGKMDFDDLILNITQLLPEITYRPKWIIVDEFQDTDDKQMAFIRALTSQETKLFAVGDPNQIIYSWRGSNQRIFDRFASEYNATQLSLPENYRSCATILEVAKCFLKTDSDLSGIREPGNLIKVKNHYNPFNEAQYIASSIQSKVEKGLKYSDIAVFYRLQRQSQVLEDVFTREGIPFEVSLKKTIKDIPVLKWVILLLRAAVNPLDIDSATAVLSDDHFGEHLSQNAARIIVKTSRDIRHRTSIDSKTILYEYGDKKTEHEEEPELLRRINRFEFWCKDKKNAKEIYDYFSINKYINPTSSSFQENQENIITLLKKIDEYIKSKGLDLYPGVKEFVNSSALYGIDILSEDIRTETDTVKLMTLHSAKGLEFRQVYIIGVNYGLIPLIARSDDEEKEERRLFFVGITRAKDDLELSYYTSPGEGRVCSGPSRYLSIIPRRLIDMEGFIQQDADLQKFRHEILERKAVQEDPIVEVPKEENNLPRTKTVCHPKYGKGTVVRENNITITVLFDGYGEKEFIKAFSELEDVYDADADKDNAPTPHLDSDQSDKHSDNKMLSNATVIDGKTIGSGSRMCVMSGEMANGTIVNSRGSLYVSSEGTVTNTTINEDGGLVVYSGGTANNTTLNSRGTLNVFSGGTANNTTLNDWGHLYVHPKGKVTNTTVSKNGILELNFPVLASGTVVNSGGSLCVYGGTVSGITALEGAHLAFTVASDTCIAGTFAGSAFAIQSGFVVDSVIMSGSLIIQNGGTANNTTLNDGYLTVSFGGTANNTTLNDWGHLIVSHCGTANGTTVNSYSKLTVCNGGTANGTSVNSNGKLTVCNGGTANGTSVNSGGELVVHNGGIATKIIENGGYVEVMSCASADFVSNNFSGLGLRFQSATVHSGTTANCTTIINHSKLYVTSGGTANDTTVNSRGHLYVARGGTANSTNVKSDGSMLVSSGGMANNTTVNKGGSMLITSDGTANSTTVKSDGSMLISCGGTANSTTVKKDGSFYVRSGGTANDTTVNSKGHLYVARGGTANGTIVSSGGEFNVCSVGKTNNTTVKKGGSMLVSSGGKAIGITVKNGGSLTILSGGTATKIVENGGYVIVEDGANADFRR